MMTSRCGGSRGGAAAALALLLFAPAAFAQSGSFSVTNITTTTAKVTLSGHSGAWHLRVRTRSGTTVSCTAQSGNISANLADLTASTTYDIVAFEASQSDCSGLSSEQIASSSFTTLATPVVNLAASSITHNSATLTITPTTRTPGTTSTPCHRRPRTRVHRWWPPEPRRRACRT